LLDDARPEVLHDPVGLGDVALEPRDGLWILEVEHDRALVHVDGVEGRPAAHRERRSPAARLVAFRALDLHDVRAHVREDLARKRSSPGPGDFDDPYAFPREPTGPCQ